MLIFIRTHTLFLKFFLSKNQIGSKNSNWLKKSNWVENFKLAQKWNRVQNFKLAQKIKFGRKIQIGWVRNLFINLILKIYLFINVDIYKNTTLFLKFCLADACYVAYQNIIKYEIGQTI